MNLNVEDMELYDRFIDISFLRLSTMYKGIKQNTYKKKKTRVRRWFVHPQNRTKSGFYRADFYNMKNMDDEQFFLHTRMSRPLFDLLLGFVKNPLRKLRQKIIPHDRLAITLAHLAHGTPINTIAFTRKIGKTTVRNIILETCDILWKVLSPKYVRKPTKNDYKAIEDEFYRTCNMPNCLGVIDSKLLSIKCPTSKYVTGAVLTAACNANNIFIAVNVSNFGKNHNEGKFSTSPFGDDDKDNEIPIPSNKPLSGKPSESVPHYFVSNNAIFSKINIMWPYSVPNVDKKRMEFNRRIEPISSLIENCLGILSARWMVLHTTFECLPENCRSILLACIALHNYIMINDKNGLYCPDQYADYVDPYGNVLAGEWRSEIDSHGFTPLKSVTPKAIGTSASGKNVEIRNKLAEFFLSEAEPQL